MSHLRITGGKARGQKVPVPNIPGVRPSSDRARTTLFNWLMAFEPPVKSLDLFAGSGILSFETLSRGAQEAYLIEKNPKVIQKLQQMSANWRYGRIYIKPYDCIKWLSLNQNIAPFDRIYLDPPFHQPELLQKTLSLLSQYCYLSPEGALYFEKPKQVDIDLPDTFELYREKLFGNVHGVVLRLQQK